MKQSSDCLADHPVVGYEAGKSQKEKVYCKSCKCIEIVNANTVFGGCPPCKCNHPDNITIISEDKWYSRIEEKTHKQSPADINKNNDCKWYDKLDTLANPTPLQNLTK